MVSSGSSHSFSHTPRAALKHGNVMGRDNLVQITALPPTASVPLDKLLYLMMPVIPDLYNGNNSNYFAG